MATSVINFIPSSSVVADFKKLYADAVIDEGAIYCYDLSNPASYPTQGNSSTGVAVKNLVEGGADSSVFGAMNFLGGGLDFTVSVGNRIPLPDAARLGAGVTDFIWSMWFKPGAQTQAIFEVGGYHYADTGPYGIRSLSATTYKAICSGQSQNFTPGTGLNAIHIALEQIDATNFLAHFFQNGVLLASKAVVGPLQQPSTGVAEAALGDVNGTSYSGYFVGRIYRSWLTTKHRTYAQILQWVQQDYELNAGYFS